MTRKKDDTPKNKDTIKRMSNAYAKRKREKKIAKLINNKDHWKFLESQHHLTNFERYVYNRVDRADISEGRTYREFIIEMNRSILEKSYNA